MINTIKITIGILAAILLGWVIYHIDGETYTATVVGKSFAPSYTSIGTTFLPDGKIGTTTEYHPESYTVIVRDDDGDVHSAEVSAEKWANAKDGSRITLWRIIWK